MYKCLKAAQQALFNAQSNLSIVLSEYLGYAVSVELCASGDVEIRRFDKDDCVDANSTLFIEDILTANEHE